MSITQHPLNTRVVAIKGAGDLATGIACRLYRAGFHNVFMMESEQPTAVRRRVAFAQAVYGDRIEVEGIQGRRVKGAADVSGLWNDGKVPVLVDPGWDTLRAIAPDVLVDAIIAKKNKGTRINDAPLVIGLGPGFTAGEDVHRVIETRRGHSLGQVITEGSALANTSVPEAVMGFAAERIIRAPAKGAFCALRDIGDQVARGDLLGRIGGQGVTAPIDGVIRGLVHDGVPMGRGRKLGDVDPRGNPAYCDIVSDKARSLGGAVLEVILERYNR